MFPKHGHIRYHIFHTYSLHFPYASVLVENGMIMYKDCATIANVLLWHYQPLGLTNTHEII